MKGNTNDPGTDQYVLDGKRKPKFRGWNFWMIVATILFIAIVIFVLDLCDVFKTSSADDDEASTMNASTTKLELISSEDETGEYLTGSSPPNMLFLLADDIGWADISHNGGRFSTPNIDELVSGGIELTNFYTQSLCTPSRMAFLTGRYAWKLGVQYPEVLHGMMTGHIPEDEKTFAEVTKEMGYDNYYVGRWGVGYASWDFTPLGRGWDKFVGYFGPEGGYYNHTTNHFSEWDGVYDFWDQNEPYVDANMTYSEDIFLDRTLEWLKDADEKGTPFTLTYSAQTAHAPIDDDWPTLYPPVVWTECHTDNENYLGREYFCNKVKYLDYTWGLIMDYLKETGMWSNMLVFVASDNGALPYTEDKEWSDWGCNWPLRGGKVTHFEGALKVWAGMTGGLVPLDYQGTTFDSMTHITDFGATAMRLAMDKTTFEGRKTLAGNGKIVDGLNIYSFEHHEIIVHNVLPQYVPSWMNINQFDYAATDGEWKYLIGTPDSGPQGHGWYNYPGWGIINEGSDYDTYSEAGGNCTHGCLFHITTDPYEYRDKSSEYPEIVFYFKDLINAINFGGMDSSYHSGQSYEKDYRGWMADNILRPYLSQHAIDDYKKRTHSKNNEDNYDYVNSIHSWVGDYDGSNNPFEELVN